MLFEMKSRESFLKGAQTTHDVILHSACRCDIEFWEDAPGIDGLSGVVSTQPTSAEDENVSAPSYSMRARSLQSCPTFSPHGL